MCTLLSSTSRPSLLANFSELAGVNSTLSTQTPHLPRIVAMHYTGLWPPVWLVRFQHDHFFPQGGSAWWTPMQSHSTHVASALVGEMPPHFETSKMVVNSVKESLQSLPSELHHLSYYPFIKRLTGKLKLVPAARHNGQESRYPC